MNIPKKAFMVLLALVFASLLVSIGSRAYAQEQSKGTQIEVSESVDARPQSNLLAESVFADSSDAVTRLDARTSDSSNYGSPVTTLGVADGNDSSSAKLIWSGLMGFTAFILVFVLVWRNRYLPGELEEQV